MVGIIKKVGFVAAKVKKGFFAGYVYFLGLAFHEAGRLLGIQICTVF